MVPWLVKHPGVSHEEAALHFGISKDQLIQDLMLLTVTGIGQYPNEQFDLNYSDGRIYVVDQLGLDRPFTFDSTEAACLLLGLDSLASLPSEVSGFNQKEIVALIDRIKESMPLSDGVDAIQNDEEVDQKLSDIASAIAQGVKLGFEYWNDARDDVTYREVSPLRITTINQTSKLDAYQSDKGWRSFRVANIDSLKILPSPADFEGQEFAPMKTIEVDLVVPTRMHHLLESFSVVKRKKIDSLTTAVKVRIAQPVWLARQVLSSGCAIEIVGPQEIKTQVEQYVELARSAYPKTANNK
jgi:proteasome accessory factor C